MTGRKYRHYSHVMDWLETPPDSPYWDRVSPVTHLDAIRARRLPMLFVGGWFDPFLPATIESFRAVASSCDDTRLAHRRTLDPDLHDGSLADAIEVVGEPEVELELSCDRPSFDLCCILSLVTSDERVLQISSGYAHYRAATARRYKLKLATTCATLRRGERLRLSVAGADYPAYPVNPGTGEDPSTPKTHAVVTTIAVWHGPSRPSLLRLPVGPGSEIPPT